MQRTLRAMILDWKSTMVFPAVPTARRGKTLASTAEASLWDAYQRATLQPNLCDTLHLFAHIQHLQVATLSGVGRALTTKHHDRLWAALPVSASICVEEGLGPHQIFRAMERLGVLHVQEVLRVSSSPEQLAWGDAAGVHTCLTGAESTGVLPERKDHPGQVRLGVERLEHLVPLLTELG